jgi:hypothetical protein
MELAPMILLPYSASLVATDVSLMISTLGQSTAQAYSIDSEIFISSHVLFSFSEVDAKTSAGTPRIADRS